MGNTVEPFDVNPRLVMAVGMLAIQWARVEFVFQKIIVGLLQSNGAVGLMLASNMGNRSVSEFIRTFASSVRPEIFDVDFAPSLQTLIAEFDRILGIRNRIVHNSWPHNISDDQALALVARFKGSVRLHEEVWDIATMEGVIDDTVQLLTTLTFFARRYDLFAPMNEWEERAASTEIPEEPKPPVYQNLDPKMIALSIRLRSSQT
ncbi:hypothetical protein GCM10010869_16570 [Mesorhizobium tianshanense]|uniref:Uncharacterized protein n=1 Tax=Mesorhizobium tianshanense TaxID=39844 RepID=A0A562NVZ9_9HYPH|nr:hypothetical protein [Mesorhizobium tianshanense]TWI36392.1 hypothetical protein IQ26_02905 [Mesorhizobium tianshanense]GLS36068.1 hypothetical protein GCM10010869_16570 [Mesorhizobium tianshanense]